MPPYPTPFRPVLAVLLGFLALSLTGCVSNRNAIASASIPPAKVLGWRTETKPVELTLQSVIVYQGPGAWKANAGWDEYVVTRRNQGSEPATLDSANLLDFQSQYVVPGENHVALEKESEMRIAKINAALGNIVELGAGFSPSTIEGPLAIIGGVYSVGAILFSGGMAAPIVIPINLGATAYRNASNSHEIEKELGRRRIAFPLTLAPGQEVTGSIFFPVTPGPARLEVKFHGSEQISALDLHLPQLAQLHFTPAPGTVATIPLHPVPRSGKYWLKLTIDTSFLNGSIEVVGQRRFASPAEITVEVDAEGHLIDDLKLVASTEPLRYGGTRRSFTKTYAAGLVPPSRLVFHTTFVEETAFGSAGRDAALHD